MNIPRRTLSRGRVVAARSKSDAKPAAPGPLLNMSIAVLQACLIAYFGFQLSGRLDVAIKDRQTTLQAARDMSDLVSKMQEEKVEDVYKTRARQIAMYGADAIEPLTMMAAQGSFSSEIPVSALKLVAIHHRDGVCNSVMHAVDSGLVPDVRLPHIKALKELLKCTPPPWWRSSP
jgi:hypothetical protein